MAPKAAARCRVAEEGSAYKDTNLPPLQCLPTGERKHCFSMTRVHHAAKSRKVITAESAYKAW